MITFFKTKFIGGHTIHRSQLFLGCAVVVPSKNKSLNLIWQVFLWPLLFFTPFFLEICGFVFTALDSQYYIRCTSLSFEKTNPWTSSGRSSFGICSSLPSSSLTSVSSTALYSVLLIANTSYNIRCTSLSFEKTNSWTSSGRSFSGICSSFPPSSLTSLSSTALYSVRLIATTTCCTYFRLHLADLPLIFAPPFLLPPWHQCHPQFCIQCSW